jgi:exodeoxyribonuclease-3
MKIISWNINSLRLRLPLLKKLVLQANPDVVCLQETKVTDASFPLSAIKALGFNFIEFWGEKSYNGVAILSRYQLQKVQKIDVLNYGHSRHISATIAIKGGEVCLHNFYVPAGGDIADANLNSKFDHKLKFVDWMTEFFTRQKNNQKNAGIIMVGDMNIAPLEHDVWSHKQLLKVVSHTPVEIAKMQALQQSLNWIDTQRLFVTEEQKLYSWWSYRAPDPFKSDRGRRLDHIWATPNLKPHIAAMEIYKNFRLEQQPSDHVPVATTFNLI